MSNHLQAIQGAFPLESSPGYTGSISLGHFHLLCFNLVLVEFVEVVDDEWDRKSQAKDSKDHTKC